MPENKPARPQVPTPREPGIAIVVAANASLANPTFRDRVRKMHADGASLVQMVDALGLKNDLTDPIRKILDDLTPDVVAGIREATLDMLDSSDYAMPLDCTVTEAELNDGIAVDVEVLPEKGIETIHVRPATASK